MVASVVVPVALFGVDMPPASAWRTELPAAVIMALPIAILFGPVTEETAFRGFAQHDLECRVSPFTASMWVGLGVLTWHIPLFATHEIPWTVAIALPAVSVVYAWLYRRGGSVWPLVILHTIVNTWSGMYVGGVFDGDAAVVRLGVLAACYVAWAGFIVWRGGVALDGRSRPATSPVVPSDADVAAEGPGPTMAPA